MIATDPGDEVYFAKLDLAEAVLLMERGQRENSQVRVQSACEWLGEKDPKALEKYGPQIRDPYKRLRELGYEL